MIRNQTPHKPCQTGLYQLQFSYCCKTSQLLAVPSKVRDRSGLKQISQKYVHVCRCMLVQLAVLNSSLVWKSLTVGITFLSSQQPRPTQHSHQLAGSSPEQQAALALQHSSNASTKKVERLRAMTAPGKGYVCHTSQCQPNSNLGCNLTQLFCCLNGLYPNSQDACQEYYIDFKNCMQNWPLLLKQFCKQGVSLPY